MVAPRGFVGPKLHNQKEWPEWKLLGEGTLLPSQPEQVAASNQVSCDTWGPGQEGILQVGGLGHMPFVIFIYLEIMQFFSGFFHDKAMSWQPALVKVLAGNYLLLLRRQVAFSREGRITKKRICNGQSHIHGGGVWEANIKTQEMRKIF